MPFCFHTSAFNAIPPARRQPDRYGCSHHFAVSPRVLASRVALDPTILGESLRRLRAARDRRLCDCADRTRGRVRDLCRVARSRRRGRHDARAGRRGVDPSCESAPRGFARGVQAGVLGPGNHAGVHAPGVRRGVSERGRQDREHGVRRQLSNPVARESARGEARGLFPATNHQERPAGRRDRAGADQGAILWRSEPRSQAC